MNVMTLTLTIPMPQIERIEPVEHLILRVTWSAGIRARRTDLIDLSPLINSLKFYRPLREDRVLFRAVHLIENGRILAWGDDDNIDMGADSVEQLAEETMTADDFRAYLRSNNLTHTEAAALLGRSRQQIENYLSGSEPIPRVFVMACYGLTARKLLLRGPLTRLGQAHAQVQTTDPITKGSTETISAPFGGIIKGQSTFTPFPTSTGMLISSNGTSS